MTPSVLGHRLLGEDGPLRSLHHRDFRLLWSGEVTRTSAQWMDQVTRGILVLQLTGSGAQLALVAAVRGAPLLVLGLLSGVLADRMDRKRLLLASQGMNVVANVVMALLVATGSARLWHVYLTALLIGVGMSLNAPARQSALPTLVPAKDLQNAVVLNASTLNIGQALGPAIGGAAVPLLGVAGAFAVQAAMTLVASQLIRRIDLPPLPTPAEPLPGMAASLVEGLRYVKGHPVLPSVLLLAAIPMILGGPVSGVVPYFATEILGTGAVGTGALLSATGVGSLVATFSLAALPPIRRAELVTVVSTAGFGAALGLFALSRSFWLSLAALFVSGVLAATYRTLNQTMLLAESGHEFRGRVSSIYVVNRGMRPVGSTLLAWLAGGVGMVGAAAWTAAACTVLALGAGRLAQRRTAT